MIRPVAKFWSINTPRASKDGKRQADIVIDGKIIDGIPFDAGDTSSQQFRSDLQALGQIDALTVHINSLGGSLLSAIAIHNMLLDMVAEKTARITSVAASAATIIAAACTVEMYPGSMQLIHCCADYSGEQSMTADDHLKAAEDCTAWDEAMVTIYARKTGKLASDIRTQMLQNSWMNAEQCQQFGLCDKILSGPAVTACVDNMNPNFWMTGGRVLNFSGFSALPTGMLSPADKRTFETQSVIAAARSNSMHHRI